MRVRAVTTALTLIAAVAATPTSNSPSKIAHPKRHWQPSVRDDGSAYNHKDDGPAYNPSDDGPAYNPKDNDNGPAPNPKDNGPAPNPKDNGSDKKPAETPLDKPKGTLTSSTATPATSTPNPAAATGSLTVTILADSNRDGKVDVTGDTDRASKEEWTETSGAVFLANIADTDGRCSSAISGPCGTRLGDIFKNNSLNVTDAEELIGACHDASDDILRNPEYLAPLRTTPNPQLGSSATGSVSVTEEAAASKVRIFHNAGGAWKFVSSDYSFKAEDLKAGLELGIDARDVRRHGGWDGRATVQLKVKDGESEATDSVMLRVAPVLTQHHGQAAVQLVAASGAPRNKQQTQFVKDVEAASSAAGLAKPLHVLQTSDCNNGEVWAQDFFEPGYTSMPGPNGPIGLHIMIGSAQTKFRKANNRVFQELRSKTAGALQIPGNGGTTDSLGNLETVPPYTYDGKSYPAGRAIMGTGFGPKAKALMMAFLEAQETQAPIEIDTSWLYIKHTDEFMQFLPVTSNKRGWVMMVDDPRAGLEILQKAEQAGHGDTPAVSRPNLPADPEEWRVTNSIGDVLKMADFAEIQDAFAGNIDKNIDILKRETGITDAEIIRIPALYTARQFWKYAAGAGDASGPSKVRKSRDEPPQQPSESSPGDNETDVLDAVQAGTPPELRTQQSWPNATDPSSLQRRQGKEFYNLAALYPAGINSVVMGGNQVLAANPWGPVIDGQDILAAAVNASYAKANYTVRYVDDWFSHHDKYSDVHCATNMIRDFAGAKWW
ncbi:hypothetical protein LLEC1_06481 [Akanthomyces lecanii]|uniref:Protein-arginine deiminase C-terminal domain-containing protein n=1 Tax=Cordyceps confragosa TaxID=2714763 RepID=A0A179IES2_CORDF|nr:hypothetical protein LLEC1_06481 [Akanthomyces lecanii]